jgi:hypothetical protein
MTLWEDPAYLELDARRRQLLELISRETREYNRRELLDRLREVRDAIESVTREHQRSMMEVWA